MESVWVGSNKQRLTILALKEKRTCAIISHIASNPEYTGLRSHTSHNCLVPKKGVSHLHLVPWAAANKAYAYPLHYLLLALDESQQLHYSLQFEQKAFVLTKKVALDTR